MPQKPTSPKPPEHTFESALERLERIVDEMEEDRMPLEQLLERYGEGTDLLRICQDKLEAAVKKGGNHHPQFRGQAAAHTFRTSQPLGPGSRAAHPLLQLRPSHPQS